MMTDTYHTKPFVIDRSRGVLVATTHPDKVKVISRSLDAHGIKVLSAIGNGIEPPEETEPSFLGNAELKAVLAAKKSGQVALADDGGFCIAALGGRPGVASRDWASEDGDYGPAIEKIGHELDMVNIHCGPAWVTSAIAIAWPSGSVLAVEGSTHGQLIWPPRGEGLDFDPIFAIDGDENTLAECDATSSAARGMPRRAYAHRPLVMDLILSKVIIR